MRTEILSLILPKEEISTVKSLSAIMTIAPISKIPSPSQSASLSVEEKQSKVRPRREMFSHSTLVKKKKMSKLTSQL